VGVWNEGSRFVCACDGGALFFRLYLREAGARELICSFVLARSRGRREEFACSFTLAMNSDKGLYQDYLGAISMAEIVAGSYG
jgi:hypothetical protein